MNNHFHPSKLVPPGVNDVRSRSFLTAWGAELERIELTSLLVNDARTVDAKLLPAMAVARTMTDFIVPGMKEAGVRKLLHNFREIHSKSGYIAGTRAALSAFDLDVTWIQWHEEEPPAPHDTHRVQVFFNDTMVEENALGSLEERSNVERLIHLTQRWSQSVSVTFGFQTKPDLHIGCFPRHSALFIGGLPDEDQPSEPVTAFISPFPTASALYQGGMES
jgi:P2-related tail formation protein